MNRLTVTRLRNAIFTFSLVASPLLVLGQDNPGNKPETMAPAESHMHAAKSKIASTALTITLADRTMTFSPADLAALPHETVTAVNGHTKQSESYSGVPVVALLAKVGLPFEKINEQTLLRTVAIAEGTDGYQVVLSTYETFSAIRGTSAIVADSLGGKPLSSEGAFKLVVPGDTRPQRWVQNLKSIRFKTLD